jgi:hypothetical protein
VLGAILIKNIVFADRKFRSRRVTAGESADPTGSELLEHGTDDPGVATEKVHFLFIIN